MFPSDLTPDDIVRARRKAAVVNPALRSKVQPQIVELVGAAESCQRMDPQQKDTLVGKIVDWCVVNCSAAIRSAKCGASTCS